MYYHITILSVVIAHGLALVDPPLITAAARLLPRQADPELVGYISASGGYSDVRSCDYPQTISTSGGYVQCCPTTGACPFYTSCSSNTLLAEGATVPCDVDNALTCNTALVATTVGANNVGSYLACWQKTLGSSPFTIVQNVGNEAVTSASGSESSSSASGSSGTSASSSSSSSSSRSTRTTSQTSSSGGSGSNTASAASTSSSGAAAAIDIGRNGFVVGALGLLAQILV